MNRVWKVASRWSETGHAGSSILDIFRRHNVVFVGKFQDRFRKIVVGDLIAISDGKRVVAMGLATTPPCPVTDLGIEFKEDEDKFDYEDHVLGCRVSFTDLDESEQRDCRIGAFHSVNERADEFRRIFMMHRQHFDEGRQFEIKAKSCALLHNRSSRDEVLWQDRIVFRVPVYQRPYSWREPEICRFVGDILSCFRGINGMPVEEPMFIGTMQLTDKKLLDVNDGRMVQEVIDGQQRLSTLILILKILKDQSCDEPVWAKIDLVNRLETKVSSGEQQRYLQEAFAADTRMPLNEGQNPYLAVMPLIKKLLEAEDKDEDQSTDGSPQAGGPLDINCFVSYLLSRVYFVVIETRATLSKTLQIFNAINTSGMDLNGGDIFKVRYYEYLRIRNRVNETEFERISALYQAIDRKNKETGNEKTCNIEDILSLMRHLLVTRHNLPKVLHDYSAAVFFDRFFDTVLNVYTWPNFLSDTCKRIEVSLEELNRLIVVRFEWERQISCLGVEARSLLEFIGWSRYRRYHYLIVLFRDRFGSEQSLTERFIIKLSKLLILFSIRFWRTVNELHGIMHVLQEKIFGRASSASAEDAIGFLHQAATERRQQIEEVLNESEIAGNATAKNLACRLSALLNEMEASDLTAEQMRGLLFDTAVDIEHIESVNHKDEEERARIQTEWGHELNRVGNLMVLEYSLNRSISNEDYKRVKLPAYSKSDFKIVKNQAKNYLEWNLDACRKRKDDEVRRLATYLCT
jgi:hypothetical protein